MFQIKVIQKLKTHILCLRDNVEKYCTVRQAIENNVAHMLCMTKATNIHTHGICNTDCFSTTTVVIPYERASVFRYTYIACLTFVDFQIDTQNSYSFTYNTFIKILFMFRGLPCSSSGGLRRNCIYAASGIVTLCR
jgi:hypothetical protein